MNLDVVEMKGKIFKKLDKKMWEIMETALIKLKKID